MAYPPQMESLRKIKSLKNKKNAKKSVFWFFAVFGGTKPGTVCLTLLATIIVPEGRLNLTPSVQQSHWQRNDWQGNERHEFGFIPLPNIPLPLFSLVSGRSQILHFVAVRVRLDASALVFFHLGMATALWLLAQF